MVFLRFVPCPLTFAICHVEVVLTHISAHREYVAQRTAWQKLNARHLMTRLESRFDDIGVLIIVGDLP